MSIVVTTYGINLQKLINTDLGNNKTIQGIQNLVKEKKEVYLDELELLIGENYYDFPFAYNAPTKSGYDGNAYHYFIFYALNQIFDLLGLKKFEFLNEKSIQNQSDENNFNQKIEEILILKNSKNIKNSSEIIHDFYILTPKTIKLLIVNMEILTNLHKKIEPFLITKDYYEHGLAEINTKEVFEKHFKDKFNINYGAFDFLITAYKDNIATLQFSEDFLISLNEILNNDLALLSV